MVLIDTDIFVIDRIFIHDYRFKINQKIINYIKENALDCYTSIFNLYELCGIMSFNLNRKQLINLMKGFEAIYDINIIYPLLENKTAEEFFDEFLADALRIILKKVAFLDSLIISIAESFSRIDIIVTWNAKHFKNKTNLNVQTPEEFLTAKKVTI